MWDELWLATLCQHHSDITKRFEQLEIEVKKVQDNISLSPEEKDRLVAEKHRIIMKPIIFILENLLAMTSVPAETPHEKNFQVLSFFHRCANSISLYPTLTFVLFSAYRKHLHHASIA